MRKIKFRAWNIERRVMYNVGDLTIRKEWIGSNSVNKLDKIGDTIGMNYLNRDKVEFELMQFTGLKDKNGKGIFEGDVLKIKVEVEANQFQEFEPQPTIWQEITCLIKWADNGACFYLDTIKADKYLKNWGFYDIDNNSDREIIGNIHENPELIK